MAECLHDLLQCSICLERFTHPKMLSCQHTFCLNCLRGIAKDDKTLACPQCRTEHQLPKGGVDGLVDNMTIKSFLNVIGEEDYLSSSEGQAACSDCGRRRGISECAHCGELICADCKASHVRLLQEIECLMKISTQDTEAKKNPGNRDEFLASLLRQITEKKKEIPEIFNDLCKSIAEREENLLRALDLLEKRVHAMKSEETRSKFTEQLKIGLSAFKTVSSLESYKNLFDQIQKALTSYLKDPTAGVELVHHDLIGLGNFKLGQNVVETGSEGHHSLSAGRSCHQFSRDKALNLPKNVDYNAKDFQVIDEHPERSEKLVPDYAVYSPRLDTIFCVSEGQVLIYETGKEEFPSFLSQRIKTCSHIAVTDSGKVLMVAGGPAVHMFDRWNSWKESNSMLKQVIEIDAIESADQLCCYEKEFAVLARNEKKILIFSDGSSTGHFIRVFDVEIDTEGSRMTVDRSNGQIYLTNVKSFQRQVETGEAKGCPDHSSYRKPPQLLVSVGVEINVYAWTGQFLRKYIVADVETTINYTFNEECGQCYYPKTRNEYSTTDDHIKKNLFGGLCVDGDGLLSLALGNQIQVYSQKPELAAAEGKRDSGGLGRMNLELIATLGKHMTIEGGFAGQLGGISLMPDGKMIICEKGSHRIIIL